MKERDDALALLRRGQCVMMRQLPRKQQIGIHVLEHRVAGPGAYAHRADLDVLHLLRLRYGDGEPLGRADAVGDALDEVGERLRLFELDQATHARFAEAFDALNRMDHAARVARCRRRQISPLELGGRRIRRFRVGALTVRHGRASKPFLHWRFRARLFPRHRLLAIFFSFRFFFFDRFAICAVCYRIRDFFIFRLRGMCLRLRSRQGPRDDVCEPIAEAPGSRIDRRVWAVDLESARISELSLVTSDKDLLYAYTLECEPQQGLLLRVCQCKGLETLEDDGVLCDFGSEVANSKKAVIPKGAAYGMKRRRNPSALWPHPQPLS